MKDYENFSKEYGVTNRSILLDALYSDVTEQIPQDVMHVILDGSLSRTLYFVIHYFLDNNIFTLEGLNAFILDFNYGYSEMKGKPVYQFGWSRQRFEKSWSNSILNLAFQPCVCFLWRAACPSPPQGMEDTTCSLSQKITINILGYFKGLVKEHLQLF